MPVFDADKSHVGLHGLGDLLKLVEMLFMESETVFFVPSQWRRRVLEVNANRIIDTAGASRYARRQLERIDRGKEWMFSDLDQRSTMVPMVVVDMHVSPLVFVRRVAPDLKPFSLSLSTRTRPSALETTPSQLASCATLGSTQNRLRERRVHAEHDL